ncbi:hypothetical protein PR048_010258 [Dryococelus australis]|uniref:39S ribosomal protein L30, mitochondrial n=1 Tax=Dryococelus australis TaxID=614101 RepID=A0ABQ9I298_9NEOP|nr:hypothetical protein PR048_010258 [Dryococelus australis]
MAARSVSPAAESASEHRSIVKTQIKLVAGVERPHAQKNSAWEARRMWGCILKAYFLKVCAMHGQSELQYHRFHVMMEMATKLMILPRFPDQPDPPYEPQKLFMVERIRPMKGNPYWDKDLLKKLGLDGKDPLAGWCLLPSGVVGVAEGVGSSEVTHGLLNPYLFGVEVITYLEPRVLVEAMKLHWVACCPPASVLEEADNQKYSKHISAMELVAFRLSSAFTQGKAVTILKNIPENNARLWRIKHLVKITPITFPNGLPEEGDYSGTYLKENGEFVVTRRLKVDSTRIAATDKFLSDGDKMDGATLQKQLRLKWLNPFN